MAEGDIEIDLTEPSKEEREARAWKLAQLAATILAGRYAHVDAANAIWAVQAAREIMDQARFAAGCT